MRPRLDKEVKTRTVAAVADTSGYIEYCRGCMCYNEAWSVQKYYASGSEVSSAWSLQVKAIEDACLPFFMVPELLQYEV